MTERTVSRRGTALTLAFYSMAKLVPGLLTFVSIPVWIDRFGATAYGQYSIVWAVSTIAGSLCVGWVRQSLLRGAGDVEWSLGRLSVVNLVGWCVLSCVPVAAVAVALSGGRPLAVFGSIALGLLSSVYVIVQGQMQRTQRATLFAATDVVRVSASLLLSLLPIVRGDGVAVLLGANALGYLIATAIALGAMGVNAGRFVHLRRVGSPGFANMWAFGWPMAVWLALSGSLIYMDRLFISTYLGQEQVGTYSAVADLINRGIPMVAFPITMMIHPIVMQKWNNGERDDARRLVRRSTWGLLALLVLGSLICVAAGGVVFDTFLPTVPFDRALLIWLAAGASLWQVALMLHKPLEFAKRTRLMLAFLCAAVALAAVADVFLVPALGVVGAAIGLTTGASAYCLLCGLWTVRWNRSHTTTARIAVEVP